MFRPYLGDRHLASGIGTMQEECLRVGEKDLAREKPANRAIYEVEDGMEKMCMITDASGSPKGRFY
jgi:hypothetical protein